MHSIITLIMSAMFLFFPNFLTIKNNEEPLPIPEYSCDNPIWIEEAHMITDNKYFKGTLGVNCIFKTIANVGYIALKDSSIKALEEEATVHSGPTETIYKDLSGVQYDVTLELADGENELSIRGDVLIVTNEIDHMIQAMLSKSVSGKGMASYIRKIDNELDITNLDNQGFYNVRIISSGVVERPWYMPPPVFLDAVKSEFEKKLVENEEQVITNIANNL